MSCCRTFRGPVRLLVVGAACAGTATASDAVSFNDDIRPILSNACFQCHGPDDAAREADRRLDTPEGALADIDGVRAIVPGRPDESELIGRITAQDETDMMPPPEHGKPLSAHEIGLIEQWIREGADYEAHWAYVKPERPTLPQLAPALERRVRTPIDRFLFARLEREGLGPSPPADRLALARRAALDLTGLSVTPEEADAFAADPSPDAFERFVDDLLSRPAFGERWAQVWLDLARYADSAGYADDPLRTIWAYRDYVIRSLNDNKPFDQFTIEQIAGDLLPDPSDEQLVATAFHRNTQTNNEGGTDDEEYRNVAVVDRVNTTLQAWMGTTMNCAQCHTHKYDPITQREYFEVFAIFNSTADADRTDESPTIDLFTDEQKSQQRELAETIARLESDLTSPSDANLAALRRWEAERTSREAEPWTPVEPAAVTAASGASFEQLDDGSLLVSGAETESDTYTIDGSAPVEQITAIRIEALADERLAGPHGPGRNGNFVLNEIEVLSDVHAAPPSGRFVRLEQPAEKNAPLHLAEVEVMSGGRNVAVDGVASQSSTYPGGDAEHAIDGNTDGAFASGSVQHTGAGDRNPWLEIDLGAGVSIESIVLWNRADGVHRRLDGVVVQVLGDDRAEVWRTEVAEGKEGRIPLSTQGGTEVSLRNPSASFEQEDFGVAAAIDRNEKSESGWGVGPRTGQDHEAVFELEVPVSGAGLRVVLKQNYGRHALGRFRISVTEAPLPVRAVPDRIEEILAVDPEARDDAARGELLGYLAEIDPAKSELRRQLAQAKDDLDAIEPVTTVPVMRELPDDRRRETHIQLRGSHLDRGEKVDRGVPEIFHPLPDGAPADRLALARWLVSPENPLTGRVIVNRFWEKIFGIGIVPTSEEFGSQGEAPTHPELLDWLAVEFQETGWDVKRLVRLMVTSAAYRQSSDVSHDLAARDPDNRLLARGPRFRLAAEMVRDQALFAAGLLSEKAFGPPVKPPQPKLGLTAAFGGGVDWETSDGEDRWRRGIYTMWRRSSPYPSMVAFDAPNREVCTVRRDRTNTPLQALVTLNDPVYVETAQALARRMLETGGSPAEMIEFGFRRCLVRPPAADETARLADLFDKAVAEFAQDPDGAAEFATDPLGAAPAGADIPELAGLTLVANVLLNLDEVLMRR